jgi:hypothetical protein
LSAAGLGVRSQSKKFKKLKERIQYGSGRWKVDSIK